MAARPASRATIRGAAIAAFAALAAATFGSLAAGAAGESMRVAQAVEPAQKSYQGVGVVIALVPRMQALVVNHDEIKGFMAAMEMMYRVSVPALLGGIEPGDKIGFTIDAGSATITEITVMRRAK